MGALTLHPMKEIRVVVAGSTGIRDRVAGSRQSDRPIRSSAICPGRDTRIREAHFMFSEQKVSR